MLFPPRAAARRRARRALCAARAPLTKQCPASALFHAFLPCAARWACAWTLFERRRAAPYASVRAVRRRARRAAPRRRVLFLSGRALEALTPFASTFFCVRACAARRPQVRARGERMPAPLLRGLHRALAAHQVRARPRFPPAAISDSPLSDPLCFLRISLTPRPPAPPRPRSKNECPACRLHLSSRRSLQRVRPLRRLARCRLAAARRNQP
jgi:hypothetical protein